MSHGKSQFCNWSCPDCGKVNDVTAYDKRRDDEITKTLNKFCPDCRAHKEHKRKDTKKGSNN